MRIRRESPWQHVGSAGAAGTVRSAEKQVEPGHAADDRQQDSGNGHRPPSDGEAGGHVDKLA